jgi:uncharacterized membrane protein
MTPGAVLTIASGLWLWLGYGIGGGWLYAKLALVLILIAHHAWLGKLMATSGTTATGTAMPSSLDQRNSRAAGADRRRAAGR